MTDVPAFEDILYEKRDNRAAWIIINRPKLYNAFRAQTTSFFVAVEIGRPSARTSRLPAPCSRTRHPWNTKYATAAASRFSPYTNTGHRAKWFSPIHPVVNGSSDSQNSRCRLAHNTTPFTRPAACIMW